MKLSIIYQLLSLQGRKKYFYEKKKILNYFFHFQPVFFITWPISINMVPCPAQEQYLFGTIIFFLIFKTVWAASSSVRTRARAAVTSTSLPHKKKTIRLRQKNSKVCPSYDNWLFKKYLFAKIFPTVSAVSLSARERTRYIDFFC